MVVVVHDSHTSFFCDSFLQLDEGLGLGISQAQNKLFVPCPPLLPGETQMLQLENTHPDLWVLDGLLDLQVGSLSQGLKDVVIGRSRTVAELRWMLSSEC